MHEVKVIVGPTSSGKTSLALKTAKAGGYEIISADSRQIYKFMDIGTGKLPVNSQIKVERNEGFWNLDGINVWAYDLIEPGQYFSAYDYAFYARNKINELHKNNKKVLLVGGTGFYIDITTGRTEVALSSPNPKLREELEQKTLEELQKQLLSLNTQIYNSIDIKNPRRVLRAVEKELSEKGTSSLLPKLNNVVFTYSGLTAKRDVLYSRVDTWLEEVWKSGLPEETRDLLKKGYGNTPQLNGLVYKSVVEYIDGNIDEESAKERAKFDLHAYIRRQQTWFKKNPNIQWIEIPKNS